MWFAGLVYREASERLTLLAVQPCGETREALSSLATSESPILRSWPVRTTGGPEGVSLRKSLFLPLAPNWRHSPTGRASPQTSVKPFSGDWGCTDHEGQENLLSLDPGPPSLPG